MEALSVMASELSPGGDLIAVDLTIAGNRDVWLMDLARDNLTRFTFDPALDGYPVWSGDGSRIAFESKRGASGTWDIMAKRANWTPAQADQFRTLAPQVEYHAMEGVGHFLMMEKPAEFNQLVAQFLTAHKLMKST